MSSLIVSNDLEIMMLEFAVEKLYVPKSSVFDSVIMKKTTVMFRLLDYDWTMLNPHRTDWVPYRGSNLEEEDFHGGKSVLFAMPSVTLEDKVNGIDIQIHVRKEVSKYFEMDSCQNVGTALIRIDDLFNGIIKELEERKELEEYLSGLHKREPISRSLKGTYEIMDEDQRESGATITVYARLSHFGKSIITEIEAVPGKRGDFYAQEETNKSFPYQCRELKTAKLEGGCWGSETFLPPLRPDQLICHCDIWDTSDEPDNESYDSDDEKREEEFHSYERPTLDSRDDFGDSGDDEKRRSRGKGSKDKKHSGSDKTRGTIDKTRHSNGKNKRRKTSDSEIGEKKKGKKKNTKVSKSESVRDSIEKIEDPGERRVTVAREEDDGETDRDIKKDSTRVEKKIKDKTSQIEADRNKFKTKKKKKERKTSQNGADTKVVERIEKSPRGHITDSAELSDHSKIIEKTIEHSSQKMNEEESDRKKKGGPTIKPRVTSTDAKQNRRSQLRRRQRGTVTVGFQDKEKKICHEALETSSTLPTTLPPVLPMSALIQPTICSNLHSPPYWCYPSIPECKPATFLPFGCSMDTRTDQSCCFFDKPNAIIAPKMAVFTN